MEKEGKELNIKNENNLLLEERQNIIMNFNNLLRKINTKESVLNISKYAVDIYNKHKDDNIFLDLLQSILKSAESTKKLENLYLLIEIIKLIHSNKENNSVKNEELFFFFEYIKFICRLFYNSPNDEFTKSIINSLKHLKECNIYPNNFIDDLIMELRLNSEPNITGHINERKSLFNLVNRGIINIDSSFISLFKDIEELKRTDNNEIRKSLIKKENDMIEKQIKLYNENLKQIKCLIFLLNKINILK
jgi:hypothetical protein